MDTNKASTEIVENATPNQRDDTPAIKSMGPIMRSQEDDLGVWQCVRRFKVVSWIAMAAAFSAALDGYRKSFVTLLQAYHFLAIYLRGSQEINLNGGIVSNKGFIKQMASPGTSIIAGKYISAWGGIQSTGQTIGQVVSSKPDS